MSLRSQIQTSSLRAARSERPIVALFSLDKQWPDATACSDNVGISKNRIGLNSVQVKQRLAFLKTLVLGQNAGTSLGSRATRSGIWVGGGFVAQRALQFASNLILTRLLFPEAFGLMALSTVFLIGLAMFSDLGIKPAIIRDPRGNEPTFLNTAWTIQAIRGAALFVIGGLLAYPISLIYGQPILFPLLATLSTTALIAGFASVQMATAERDLDLKTVTIVQLGGQAAAIIVTVALAYWWRSLWSLAIGNIVASMVTLALSHILLRGHIHRFQLDAESAKSLVNFGKWIFLATIVTFVGGEGLRAIQAGFLTTAEFGILAIAYTIAAIPIELSLRLSTSIGLPALSEAYRKDPEKLHEGLHKFRKRLLTLSLLLVSAVAVTSEPLIELLYDQRYHDAGLLVVAIALSGAVTLISSGYGNALLAIGKSKDYLGIMTFAAIVRVVGTIVGFEQSGILGLFIGIGLANILVLVTYQLRGRPLRIFDPIVDILAMAYIALLALGLWAT